MDRVHFGGRRELDFYAVSFVVFGTRWLFIVFARNIDWTV
jgi:hypothetical protein